MSPKTVHNSTIQPIAAVTTISSPATRIQSRVLGKIGKTKKNPLSMTTVPVHPMMEVPVQTIMVTSTLPPEPKLDVALYMAPHCLLTMPLKHDLEDNGACTGTGRPDGTDSASGINQSRMTLSCGSIIFPLLPQLIHIPSLLHQSNIPSRWTSNMTWGIRRRHRGPGT